jgi:hypothetical protein
MKKTSFKADGFRAGDLLQGEALSMKPDMTSL